MNIGLTRKLGITAVALFILGFVSFAHSQSGHRDSDPNVRIYRTSHWLLSNCTLKVIRDGSNFTYVPSSYSKSEFLGFWPQTAGDMSVDVTTQEQGDEKLIIRFEPVNGELQPTGYLYQDNRQPPLVANCMELHLTSKQAR